MYLDMVINSDGLDFYVEPKLPCSQGTLFI